MSTEKNTPPPTDEQLSAWQALSWSNWPTDDYVAEARDALQRLLAEVRRLRGAVAAEREACARLADAHKDNYLSVSSLHPRGELFAEACRILAREIRARKE